MKRNNMPSFQSHLSRHPHDTSAGYTSTIAPGLIVPQFADVLSPNDTVYFDTYMWTRLKDVVTAFLGEIEFHIDYFFVPLQMMYTPFGETFFQTNDFVTSMFDSNANPNLIKQGKFPVYNIEGFIDGKDLNSSLGSEPLFKSIMRLSDSLNLNPMVVLSETTRQGSEQSTSELPPSAATSCPSHTPWLECAYQAIYQNYYRDDDIEARKLESYNFDTQYNQVSQNFMTPDVMMMRSVHRYNDYFTSVKVSPIYSAVNAHPFDSGDGEDGSYANSLLNSVRSFLGSVDVDTYLGKDDNFETSDFNSLGDYTNTPMKNKTSVFNVASDVNNVAGLRNLFAIDKFLRIYGRAGKTYDDQVLAHFGYKVPHDVKHQITHIKGYHFNLSTTPVYSTGAGDGVVLGQVGGQGMSEFKSQHQEKFTAPVHGVFMAVAYCITKPRYFGTFSKLNTLNDRLAFPIPEFDKLGFQPLYAFEAGRSWLPVPNMGKRLGWQYRYNEFKQKWNHCSIHFMGSDGDFEQGQSANVYNSWIVSRPAFYGLFWQYTEDDVTVLDTNSLLEQPDALNNVMVVEYSSLWDNSYFKKPWLVFQTDPIITEFFCRCKKVSFMSPTGEPDL